MQKFPNARFQTLEQFQKWYKEKRSNIRHGRKQAKEWRTGSNSFWTYIWKGEYMYMTDKYVYHNANGPAEINEYGHLYWYMNNEPIPAFNNLWREDLNQDHRNYLKLLKIKYRG